MDSSLIRPRQVQQVVRRLPRPNQRRGRRPAPPPLQDAEGIAAMSAGAEPEEAQRRGLREALPKAFFLQRLRRSCPQKAATKARHGAGGRRGPIPLFGVSTQTIIRIGGAPETIGRPPLLYGRDA